MLAIIGLFLNNEVNEVTKFTVFENVSDYASHRNVTQNQYPRNDLFKVEQE